MRVFESWSVVLQTRPWLLGHMMQFLTSCKSHFWHRAKAEMNLKGGVRMLRASRRRSFLCTRTTRPVMRAASRCVTMPQDSKRQAHTTDMRASKCKTYYGRAEWSFKLSECATCRQDAAHHAGIVCTHFAFKILGNLSTFMHLKHWMQRILFGFSWGWAGLCPIV